MRGVGEATDIVRKEMYTFDDKGGRSITLRPEGTASIVPRRRRARPAQAAAAGEALLRRPDVPLRAAAGGPHRQFCQIGAEALGTAEPTVDAEVIALLVAFLRRASGVEGVTLLINSMGDEACRPAYREKVRGLHPRPRRRAVRGVPSSARHNPLRAFDCKIAGVPRGDGRGAAHQRRALRRVPRALRGGARAGLDAARPRLRARTRARARPRLLHAHRLRGQADRPRRAERVGGGGRYDGLVEQFGGPPTPGLGFGSASSARARDARPRARPIGARVFVVSVADAARPEALRRGAGPAQRRRAAELDLAGRSPKAQFKQADRSAPASSWWSGRTSWPKASGATQRTCAGGGEEDVAAGRPAGARWPAD